jgi:ribonuclease HII
MGMLVNKPEELYKFKNIVGLDEAGAGVLAGPVVASAVILPDDLPENFKKLIKDSKKLSEKKRNEAYHMIIETAIEYKFSFIDVETIEKINILNARFLGMHHSLNELKIKPDHIMVDGNSFNKWNDVPHTTYIKGDNLYYNIAAASIISKVVRDEYMKKLHEEYPNYDWVNNKGYGTPKHIKGIKEFGITPYHRKSFLKNII